MEYTIWNMLVFDSYHCMLFQVVIYDVHGNKNKCEIYHDVPDATEWIFSNKVLIKVVRGW